MPDYQRQLVGMQAPLAPLWNQLLPGARETEVAILSKKISVYRPLLRLFRRYFRKDALRPVEHARIHSKPLEEQGLLYAEALALPDQLRNPRSQNALLLLIDSHRITVNKQIVPNCVQMMEAHIDDIWVPFFSVFNECNRRNMWLFFSDPLIQFLWALFRVN